MKRDMRYKVRSHMFRGRRYLVKHIPLTPEMKVGSPDAMGTCEGPPSMKYKAITLDPALEGMSLLKVAIDEGIHACVWDFDNTAVNEMSESISRFLWRLGFRKMDEVKMPVDPIAKA